MPAIKLSRTVDVEPSLLVGERSLKDHLQQQVAQLFPEHLGRPVIDRVDHLVGLLDHVLPEGLERLLPIPRATGWPAQESDELLEFSEAVGHDG